MGGHYIKGRATSANWAWRLAAFAALVVPLAVVFFRLALLDLSTLSWALVAGVGFAALALLLALYAIARVWTLGEAGGGRAAGALAVALLTCLPFGLAAYLFAQNPRGSIAETAGLAATATLPEPASEGGGVLPGRDFQATASMVYGAARTAMADRGIDILDVATATTPSIGSDDLGVSGTVPVPVPTPRGSVDASQTYDRFAELDADEYTITGVAFAPLLALPSDVTVRIVEENGETYVDMRSASRTVENDFGVNRRIVQSFFASLDEAMNVLEGVTAEGG